jgi:hypothetical protein
MIFAILVLLCCSFACSDRDAAAPRPAPPSRAAQVPPSPAAGPPHTLYRVVPPQAGPPKVVAEPMRAAVTTGPGASPRIASPGTYWPRYACVRFHTENQSVGWHWCVESVTLRPEGEMVLRCVWELDDFYFDPTMEKGSDEGNRNMYVVDGRGRRYDTVATTEFVKVGGKLTKEAPAKRGDFVFRASGTVYWPLTFHDDDQKTAIAGIELDPARMSGRVRRPRPGGEDVSTLLRRIRQADRVELFESRQTSSREGATESSEHYVLRREGALSTEGVAVPTSIVDGFLARLADAPLLDGPYSPDSSAMHHRQHYSMTIGTGDDPIVFFSDSLGADRVPWAVQIEGRRYVIPSDAPARALDLVRPYLAKGPTPVEPGPLSSRRPDVGPGRYRRQMVAAAGSGRVEELRLLLAAGADPERGDDESGESPLHIAASGGQAAIVTLLIQAGARPDVPDHHGFPPLVQAAANGHWAVVRLLLKHGARSGLQDALMSACEAGAPDAVRMLLGAGAAVDGESTYGLTPLMHAVSGVPKPEMVRLLLASGAAVNAADPDGRTALFIAAMPGTGASEQTAEAAKEVVRMLLHAGADPQAKATQIGTVMDVLKAMPDGRGREMLAILREGRRR